MVGDLIMRWKNNNVLLIAEHSIKLAPEKNMYVQFYILARKQLLRHIFLLLAKFGECAVNGWNKHELTWLCVCGNCFKTYRPFTQLWIQSNL